MSNRRAVVGVMGAGEGASAEAVALAEELGECISARGWVLLTGGRPAGVMVAVSRGAARVMGHLVVVLPDQGNGDDRQSGLGCGPVHRHGYGPQRDTGHGIYMRLSRQAGEGPQHLNIPPTSPCGWSRSGRSSRMWRARLE